MRGDCERLRQSLLPIEAALAEWPAVALDEAAAGRVVHGAAVALPVEAAEMLRPTANIRVHNQAGMLIALARIERQPDTEEMASISLIQPFQVLVK